MSERGFSEPGTDRATGVILASAFMPTLCNPPVTAGGILCASLVFQRRMDSSLSSMRWAVWINRSGRAPATVGGRDGLVPGIDEALTGDERGAVTMRECRLASSSRPTGMTRGKSSPSSPITPLDPSIRTMSGRWSPPPDYAGGANTKASMCSRTATSLWNT